MPSPTRRRFLAGSLALLGSAAGCLSAGVPLVDDGKRGRGDPVSVRQELAPEHVTYVDETNEVRYPALMSGDGVEKYETEPFRKWGRRRCASVGVEVVVPTIEARFGGPLEGVGRGVASRLPGLVIVVDHATRLGDDGTVESRPNVSFDRLVDLAPRAVNATVVLDGNEVSRAVPVIVDRFEYRSPGPLVYSPNGSATTPSR